MNDEIPRSVEEALAIPTQVEPEPYYPSGDGQPMGETTIHVEAILLLHLALQDCFRGRPDVFIASDIFWYWEKGAPASCCAPDTMVVLGVPAGHRRSFFSWREKNPIPNAIFEIASENTWQENLGAKKELYERLRVPEYFIFDPLAEFVNPPLRGFRLRGKTYRPIRRAADGHLVSQQLGLRLVPEGTLLRLLDARTGEKVLTKDERIEQELREKQALEAEVARLRILLARSQRPADPEQR